MNNWIKAVLIVFTLILIALGIRWCFITFHTEAVTVTIGFVLTICAYGAVWLVKNALDMSDFDDDDDDGVDYLY